MGPCENGPAFFMKRFPVLLLIIFFCMCTGSNEETPVANAELLYMSLNGQIVSPSRVPMVDGKGVEYVLSFSKELNANKLNRNNITCNGALISDFDFTIDGKDLHIKSNTVLPFFKKITLNIYAGENFGVLLNENYKLSFITEYDPSDKFDRISEEELFEKVQKLTFSYFWDYAHPVSGLARERLGSGNTVATGGSGFGVMCIPVGIERGWITREEGAERVFKIVTFLQNKAQRFHGAWSHWLDGESGKAKAFSTYDDGADLVETAFMIQGLLAVKEYFNLNNTIEKEIRNRIQALWEQVEWTWFQQNGQKKLFWHWSENYGWKMNMPITGWNEGLIVYILAAASPTYPIEKDVYDNGWAQNGSIRFNQASPMFFSHYSFLGLDPRRLEDVYGNYWDINVAHAKYNYEYCVNSKSDYGYSSRCWGLTASDYYKGYTASSPSNDTGTIAPTAALADFPYTPEQSKAALEYFYYVLGDRLLGEYGFKDAFALKECWFANSYIAIDQGPIVVMMENYRTGLLWNCFMKNKDVLNGLDRLGFKY